MATVVLSAFNVANYPEGGGHFWVYMQYALGLRQRGCEVYWLEQFRSGGDRARDARAIATFLDRMRRFGFDERVLLYAIGDQAAAPIEYMNVSRTEAETVLRRADLILNFHYGIDPRIVGGARRTALVDIDPGLTQWWITTGQIAVPPHDVYFTIGETVGTPAAVFPDCGLEWVHIAPPVHLESWPSVESSLTDAFTTIAGWWSGKWIKVLENGTEVLHDNNKRIAFLEYLTLPQLTAQALELALLFGSRDEEDRGQLEQHGWRVRDARQVTSSPEAYRAYVQASRGEWSCAKPFFVKMQNAWVSDRTACYLASGKPAVVQHTGPSRYLPDGEGLLRFKTPQEAADALSAVNQNYRHHCRAARDIAETYFDATQITAAILNRAMASQPQEARRVIPPHETVHA